MTDNVQLLTYSDLTLNVKTYVTSNFVGIEPNHPYRHVTSAAGLETIFRRTRCDT